MLTCPSCGQENPSRFRLCGFCGAALEGTLEAPEKRKLVTVVFSDLKGSTNLGEALDPETLREVMTSYFDAMKAELVRHGGTIEKYIGDAIMAVFGLPVAHEDDALRAVRATSGMQRALGEINDQLDRTYGVRLQNRTGVHTGEVVTGDASTFQRLVTGDVVNTAARLEQAAPTNEVLIGDLTRRLVSDAAEVEPVEPLELKGKAERVSAWRVVRVTDKVEVGRRIDTPLVGRERELAILGDVFGDVVRERQPRLVTVVADAGVGKTRLGQEFLDAVRHQATVVRGRCLSYGEGVTFWPVVEIVRDAAGLLETDTPAIAIGRLHHLVGDEAVVDRMAAAVGLSDAPFQVGELFWGIRRFLEILAAGEPLVVLFDDIHWAEPTFIDLLGHLAADAHDEPILLLCLARHELLENRPEWGGAPDRRTIVLLPLSDADASRVIENLLGEVGLADAVRERVVTAAEGNPLFVEQLVSMLRETGMLRLDGGRWEPVGDLSRSSIPPTIRALLAARLDRLPAGERAVIDPASVIGVRFSRTALEAIVEDPVRGQVPERLDALTMRQLVRPPDGVTGEGAEYRFAHLMIREAAYAGLLKRRRAELHERFVRWADEAARTSGRATEFEEILGYHLEQAHRYLSELGPLDELGEALGIDASGRLASAGQRAYVRGDMPATASLVRRAASLLPDDHPRRPRLHFQLALALHEIGEREAADTAFGWAIEGAAAHGDAGLETTARLERLMTQYDTDPSKVEGDIEAQIRAYAADLAQIGDEAGLARAWLAMTDLRAIEARWGAATDAAKRVIEHARRAGDRVLEIRAAPNLAVFAQLGPTPVQEAIQLCEEIIARSGGDRKAEAVTLRSLAHLHAMQGEFEAARDEYRRSRATLEELGWKLHAALTSIDSGPIELLAEDPVAAEAELRRDYATLDELGDCNFISTVAAYLAEALYQQSRFVAADAMASFGDVMVAPDDVATQVILRSVRAKLLTESGRHDEAETLCREAVEMSRTEDDPIDQATSLSALAHVLRASGKRTEALEVQSEALALYETKGDVVSAALARRSLGGVAGPT